MVGGRFERLWTGELPRVEYQGALEATRALGGPWSLSLRGDHATEVVALTLGRRISHRGLAVLSLGRAGWGSLAVLYGYTNESAASPTHYPGLELSVDLPRGGMVRLFGGRLSGGQVCAGGLCRDLPPFEGLRLDLVLRY